MDGNRFSFRIDRRARGPATEALSRDGVDRLVEDAVHDLAVLKREVTPDGIREYVEDNVRINVDIGRYLAPHPTDLEEALEPSLLELRCARACNGGSEKADATPFRR